MKLRRLLAVIIAVTFTGWLTSSGATITAVTTTGGTTQTNFSGSVGFRFTVGSQDMSVTGLGYYAPYLPTGTTHQVAIFNDSTDTLVGSVATVASTGVTTAGTWIYNSVTPFTLSANTTYDAMASNISGTSTTTNNSNYLTNATSPTYGTDLTFNIMVYNSASNNANVTFPNSTFSGNNPGAFNPNFQYTVPEPASVGLLSVGALSLLARRRRF